MKAAVQKWSRLLLCALALPFAALADDPPQLPGPQLQPAYAITDPQGQTPAHVRTARAANGRAIVAWASGRRVYLQRLDAQLQPQGAPQQVFDFTMGVKRIEVAISDGSHVIVVTSGTPDEVGDNVHVRRYKADGSLITQTWEDAIGEGPYAVVAPYPDTEECPRDIRYNEPDVSMDAAGNYAMVWNRTVYAMCRSLAVLSSRVYYRYVPAEGAASPEAKLIYEVDIADPFNADRGQTIIVWRRPAVALADSGRAVVSWVAGVTGDIVRQPLLARRLQQNEYDGTTFEVIRDQRNVERPVVRRAGFGFLIAWDMREPTEWGPGTQRAWFHRLDAQGALLGDAADAPNGYGLNALAVEADGAFTTFLRNTVEGWWDGRRFAADGAYQGYYFLSGEFVSDEVRDTGPAAVAPYAVGGDYLTVYRDDEGRLQVVAYGGPEGTKALDFRANRTEVKVNGNFQDVLLRWASNAGGKCTLAGTWQGQAEPYGYREIGPWSTPGPRSYQMVCPGASGPGPLNKTVTINVQPDGSTPAPTLSLALEPSTVVLNDTALLRWDSEHADECMASGDGWPAAPRTLDGEQFVRGDRVGELHYTLRCTGAGGEVEKTATLTVLGDGRPDDFAFASVNDAQPAQVVESEAVTITGLNVAAPISIAGGEYRIGAGLWTSTAGTIQPGESVRLRLSAAAEAGVTRSATLTIGGVSAIFSVTTALPPDEVSTVTISAAGGDVSLSASAGEIVNARSVPRPAGAPDDRSYPHGFFAFDIENVPAGESISVAITLPAGSQPDRYVKCNAAGTSCRDFPGASFAGNVITLVLTDNGDGDNDPRPGRISDPGAPALRIEAPVSGDDDDGETEPERRGGGGALSPWLLLLALLPGLRRFRRQ